jgi:hypothetical protein
LAIEGAQENGWAMLESARERVFRALTPSDSYLKDTRIAPGNGPRNWSHSFRFWNPQPGEMDEVKS